MLDSKQRLTKTTAYVTLKKTDSNPSRPKGDKMAIQVRKNMLSAEYEWEAAAGDDATKIKQDATLFNRHEGYEVI